MQTRTDMFGGVSIPWVIGVRVTYYGGGLTSKNRSDKDKLAQVCTCARLLDHYVTWSCP